MCMCCFHSFVCHFTYINILLDQHGRNIYTFHSFSSGLRSVQYFWCDQQHQGIKICTVGIGHAVSPAKHDLYAHNTTVLHPCSYYLGPKIMHRRTYMDSWWWSLYFVYDKRSALWAIYYKLLIFTSEGHKNSNPLASTRSFHLTCNSCTCITFSLAPIAMAQFWDRLVKPILWTNTCNC